MNERLISSKRLIYGLNATTTIATSNYIKNTRKYCISSTTPSNIHLLHIKNVLRYSKLKIFMNLSLHASARHNLQQ